MWGDDKGGTIEGTIDSGTGACEGVSGGVDLVGRADMTKALTEQYIDFDLGWRLRMSKSCD